MADDKKTVKYTKTLKLKNSCGVVNYSEVPIKVFAISHKDFLQKVRKKFLQDDSFSLISMRSSKFKDQVREFTVDEYDDEEKNEKGQKKGPASCVVHMKGKWVVLAIYMDVSFDGHFTLWRLIEGKPGLQVNVRDDHIDETELADNNDHDEVIEALPAEVANFIEEFSRKLKDNNN